MLLCQGVNNVTQHLIPPVIDATTECNLSFEDETTNGQRTYTVDGGSSVVDRAGPSAERNVKYYKRIIMPGKWYDGDKPSDNDNVRPKKETACLVVCGGISIRQGDYESSPCMRRAEIYSNK